MKDKEYFLTHNDCVMTAVYFKNKDVYDRMSCGVIHGNGCDKSKCYDSYTHVLKYLKSENDQR